MKSITLSNTTLTKSVSMLKSSTALPEISYSFDLVFTLSNPDVYDGFASTSTDKFATAIAASDSYTIVGAPEEGDPLGNVSGMAYIYSNTTGQLLYTIRNPNAYGTPSNDYFGSAVDINENYAVVTAYNEADENGVSSGKAYVFSTATGQLVYQLDNPNGFGTVVTDQFGRSVAISDNYIIVGAYSEDDSGGTTSGKAYVFSLANGQLVYTLDNPNATGTTLNDFFGIAFGITDTYAIVSAHQEDVGGSSSGSAYIFSMSDGSLVYTLNNPNGYGSAASDFFGRSVDISGNYAVVGAYGEDDANGTTSGKAYIYSLSDGSLLHTLNNPNPVGTSTNDFVGINLDISGNYAIFGAYGEEGVDGYNSGKAYLYTLP